MLYNTPMRLYPHHDTPRPLGFIHLEDKIYDPSDIALSELGTWEGAVLFMDCPHRGIRGWWHSVTGRKAHIVGYVRSAQ